MKRHIVPTHSYAKSAELAYLYDKLYPALITQNPQAFNHFLTASTSPSQLKILESQPSQHALALEPDFLLRQFLWVIRPAPDFLAYAEFYVRWQGLYARRHTLGLTHLLPWDQLHQVATNIHGHIHQFMALAKTHPKPPTLFPKWSITSKNPRKTRSTRLANPMKGHSSADFPLYTILLESPAKAKSLKRLENAFDHLISLVLVHEAGQLEVSSTQQHAKFVGPYAFLEVDQHRGPGHALLSNVQRAIRKYSDQLRYTSFEQHLAPSLLGQNYHHFQQHCERLEDTLNPLPKDNDYLGYLLHYFASERQSRAPNGLGGARQLRRADAGTGGHYWNHVEESLATEEALGLNLQVTRAKRTLPEEHLADAQDAGEDPFEDTIDSAQAELLFVEDTEHEGNDHFAQSRLILNQHTSHSQQLMATHHQRIWWSQTPFTLEDMALFHQFLETHRSANPGAADLLQIVLLLGVDLERALCAYLAPDQASPRWIKGKTRPAFGIATHPENIILTRALLEKYPSDTLLIEDEYLPVWSCPIPAYAYLEGANSEGTGAYTPHATHIAFRDESGLIESLRQRIILARRALSTPVPLFATTEHDALREEVKALLHAFNELLHLHASRPQERRLLTIPKIQQFYRAQLQRAQLDHALLDALDWNTPLNQIPTLHYYTHQLHQPVKHVTAQSQQQGMHQPGGLQYALSTQTGMFRRNAPPFLPPTKNWSIGATQLLKVETLQTSIQKLTEAVRIKLMDPGSEHYLAFLDTVNRYSFYVMLWFCLETSHRPHHTPYLNIDDLDLLHGIVKLKDKSNLGGDKYRLSYLSPELRTQMRYYADMLTHLSAYLKKFGLKYTFDHQLCIYLSVPDKSLKNSARLSLKHGLTVQVIDAKRFRLLVKEYLGDLAPNFYRKLMVHLFLSQKDPHGNPQPLASEHIRHWLGHWTHGTAPTNPFKTTDHLAYIQELRPLLQEIIAGLGFAPIQLKLPRLPSKNELLKSEQRQPALARVQKKKK